MAEPSANPTTAGPFRIDALTGGFLGANGTPFVPVGVNYWPASCGVELWSIWPEAEIRTDLDLVRSLGLNTVRFFLRWQDFEFAPGRYHDRAFACLEEMLRWHRERGLLAHPALFVGYMSGGVFWPPWHHGRNVFADPDLRARAIAFTEKAAAICARFPETVLAIDLGNELSCLPDSAAASPGDVTAWCGDISSAIRRSFPDALVVSGSEQTQINMDVGWRFGAQPGCDFYSMHTYPVSAWHSLAFDGMNDPLAQSLLPFYVKCARAWGPVMVQEFGTLFTRGESHCDAYLRAILPACLQAGANGFLWWCLRDIAQRGHPYDKFPFEGQLGLVDASGCVKPALRYFLEFVRQLPTTPPPAPSPAIAVYWPREYYLRDNPLNPGNDPGQLSRQLAVAHFALLQSGFEPGLIRSTASLSPDGILVIAGARLTAGEIEEITNWVQHGGRLIWHGPDALAWGAGLEALLGAEPLDFRGTAPRSFDWLGTRWEFSVFPRDIFVEARPTSARVLATDAAGLPVVLHHALGRGCVLACLADVERQFALASNRREGRERWTRWYRGALAAL